MSEYSQSWRKKIRLKLLVDIARQELQNESHDENGMAGIRERLDSEMKARWKLVKNTRKEYLDLVEKILKKEYVLNA